MRESPEDRTDTFNRTQAMQLLEEIQIQAVKAGLNSMTMDEINAEITAHRQENSVQPNFSTP